MIRVEWPPNEPHPKELLEIRLVISEIYGDGTDILRGQSGKGCHRRGLTGVGAVLYLLRERSTIPRADGERVACLPWLREGVASSQGKRDEETIPRGHWGQNLSSLSG